MEIHSVKKQTIKYNEISRKVVPADLIFIMPNMAGKILISAEMYASVFNTMY